MCLRSAGKKTWNLQRKNEYFTYQEVTDFPLSASVIGPEMNNTMSVYVVFGIEHRTPVMLAKQSSNWSISPTPSFDLSFEEALCDWCSFYKCFSFSSRRKSSFVMQLFLFMSSFFLNSYCGEMTFWIKCVYPERVGVGLYYFNGIGNCLMILKLLEFSKYLGRMSYWVCWARMNPFSEEKKFSNLMQIFITFFILNTHRVIIKKNSKRLFYIYS